MTTCSEERNKESLLNTILAMKPGEKIDGETLRQAGLQFIDQGKHAFLRVEKGFYFFKAENTIPTAFSSVTYPTYILELTE